MSQPLRILIGLILGTVAGLLAHALAFQAPWLQSLITEVARPLGQLFLRLIFMIVVPLIFSVLVLGVYELGDSRVLGRLGAKALAYTLFASTTSVLVGLTFVSVFAPGRGLTQLDFTALGIHTSELSKNIEQAQGAQSLSATLLGFIPKNPLAAAVAAFDGEIIAFMVFSLIFGIALMLVRGKAADDPLVGALATVRDTCMQVVDFAMRLAPVGIGALMFAMTANFGWVLLTHLAKYILVVLGGLLFQQVVVLGALLKFYTKRSPFTFLRDIREVIVMAFATASSNATLPTSIRVTKERLQVDDKIASFMLTVGSAANQNGTALFEGVTVLFLAQVFGIELSLTEQGSVLFMSIFAGMGTAGVPGGSLPMILVVMQSVGIPAEGLGLVLGVDRLLDMARTVLNVTGDMVGACVVAESERRRLPPS